MPLSVKLLPLIILVIAAAVIVFSFPGLLPWNVSGNPFAFKQQFRNPNNQGTVAAAQQSPDVQQSLSAITSQPQATWLTPEGTNVSNLTGYVQSLMTAANAQHSVPVFVSYAIPNRDCGGYSAGGLSSTDYPTWIQNLAAGIGSQSAVVILEPDALAYASSCGDASTTTTLLKNAVQTFAQHQNITVYLDAGHSNWVAVPAMAKLLVASGVQQARGFATNVSNIQPLAVEQQYANALAAALPGSTHYVIDTSRNGATSAPTSQWCNPPSAGLGVTPGATFTSARQDASLWIKNPGESDGTCNGGPNAGTWWQDGALSLIAHRTQQ